MALHWGMSQEGEMGCCISADESDAAAGEKAPLLDEPACSSGATTSSGTKERESEVVSTTTSETSPADAAVGAEPVARGGLSVPGIVNDEDPEILFSVKTPIRHPRMPALEPGAKLMPKHMLQLRGEYSRHKSNSTSTLFVNSTLSAPDINQILNCMASAIFYHIESGHRVVESEQVFYEIFDERKHPLEDALVDTTRVPRVKKIYKFLASIFSTENLPAEVAILCLAYVERLISKTDVTLHASNWRRIVLSALILASKVWEDQAVWNVDFLSVFPSVDVRDLNLLEKNFLELIKYNVSLKGSTYAKYYFELRGLAEENDRSFPLKPLDKDQAELLEERAQATERRVKGMQRSSSSESLKLPKPPIVLS